ncbi:SurA N-terminal domain-containing protein [Phytoactinopolyspora endophytica]|uniref:SurA N-terminal domain-containing protein n=1 Tax=Phytoactinopolyspora endophytica TaxID=1642495 RepID=UPI001F0FC1C8|nr:SurA N-terminal domain-containing protein [Phytoactinopolyspora endophytica]
MARRVLAATAAVAAVSFVTACEPDQVGTAVNVGDDRLSVSELQDEVTETIDVHNDVVADHGLELPPLNEGGDVTELQNTVLGRWIENRLFDDVAQDQGLDVSAADVDDFLDEWRQQFENGDPAPFYAQENFTQESLREEVRKTLIYEELVASAGDEAAAQAAVNEAMERLDIDVNPRYGTWGEAGFQPTSGSVSEPFEDEALDAGEQLE